MPLSFIDSKNQKIAEQIIALVDEVLKLKESDKNADTKELESRIDFIVYKLYNITDDETKIIENKE